MNIISLIYANTPKKSQTKAPPRVHKMSASFWSVHNTEGKTVGNCKIYTPYFCIYPKNINDGDSNDMLDDVIRINNHSELNQLNFPFFGIYISMSNINSDCQMLTHIKIHI